MYTDRPKKILDPDKKTLYRCNMKNNFTGQRLNVGLGLHKQSMSLYQMFQTPGPEQLKLQFWSFQSQNASLVNIQKAIENGPVEIVGFPIKNGDVPLLCKRSPEGISRILMDVIRY